MEAFGIIGMIFGMSALTFVLQALSKIKALEERLEKLEMENRKEN